jgi:hypothetical protein
LDIENQCPSDSGRKAAMSRRPQDWADPSVRSLETSRSCRAVTLAGISVRTFAFAIHLGHAHTFTSTDMGLVI